MTLSAILHLLDTRMTFAKTTLFKFEPCHKKKPVFGVFDLVSLKPTCSATEASESHEIANIETRDVILSRQRKTKALIRLRGCAG